MTLAFPVIDLSSYNCDGSKTVFLCARLRVRTLLPRVNNSMLRYMSFVVIQTDVDAAGAYRHVCVS